MDILLGRKKNCPENNTNLLTLITLIRYLQNQLNKGYSYITQYYIYHAQNIV